MADAQVILEEDYDPNYEPNEQEVREYAQFLGMNVETDQAFFWIAREGLKAPLPKDWKPCQTDDGQVYYFNFSTGESIWDHPCDSIYREKFKQEKSKIPTRSISLNNSQDKMKSTGSMKSSGSTSGFAKNSLPPIGISSSSNMKPKLEPINKKSITANEPVTKNIDVTFDIPVRVASSNGTTTNETDREMSDLEKGLDSSRSNLPLQPKTLEKFSPVTQSKVDNAIHDNLDMRLRLDEQREKQEMLDSKAERLAKFKRELEEKERNEMEAIKSDFQRRLDQLAQDFERQKMLKSNELEEQKRVVLQEMQESFKTQLEEEEAQLKRTYNQQLVELRSRMASEFETTTNQLRLEENHVDSLNRTIEEKKQIFERDLAEIEKAFDVKRQEKRVSLQQEIDLEMQSIQKEYGRRKSEVLQQLNSMEHEERLSFESNLKEKRKIWEEEENVLRKAHEEKIRMLRQKHSKEIEELNDVESKNLQMMLDDRTRELEQLINEMEEKVKEQKMQRLKLEQEQEFLDCLEKELRARREHLKNEEDIINKAFEAENKPPSPINKDEPITLDEFKTSNNAENQVPSDDLPKNFIQDYFQSFRKSLTEDIGADLHHLVVEDETKIRPVKELRKKYLREDQQIARIKQFLNNMTEDVAMEHVNLDRVRDNWKKDLEEVTKVLGTNPDPILFKRHREVLDLENELKEEADRFATQDLRLDERLMEIKQRISNSQIGRHTRNEEETETLRMIENELSDVLAGLRKSHGKPSAGFQPRPNRYETHLSKSYGPRHPLSPIHPASTYAFAAGARRKQDLMREHSLWLKQFRQHTTRK